MLSLANKEHCFRITRLKGTPNVSLVGYVNARNNKEAIEKAIKKFKVPEELQARLVASIYRKRTLPRAASPVASECTYELAWMHHARLKTYARPKSMGDYHK